MQILFLVLFYTCCKLKEHQGSRNHSLSVTSGAHWLNPQLDSPATATSFA